MRLLPLILALLAPAALAASPAGTETLRICDDGGGWPPYIWQDGSTADGTPILKGYSVDVLKRIADDAGLDFKIDMLPWERCQALLKRGMYELALGASLNPERERDYMLSHAYYQTTSVYFYSRQRYPKGLAVQQLPDLKKYRVCGLHGYNYETYGLGPKDVDRGTSQFPQLIAKLHAGHCDLFIEKREVMVGFSLTDAKMKRLLHDTRLTSAPVPGVTATSFHMMLSRATPRSRALLTLLNAGIDAMAENGELAKLRKRYLP
ncbi:hypothetical protein GCM10007907_34900 [Chitinimonas prasina]|uniref:Solute-binding protein family 3/N-terminal domain-containing protein n=1 Tax=Chitinimonas prasina TaxID=1434937 RepID=A0ABQ5YI77_9NEIS|nr:transporter substrate-binding domain-containing protein [Chitinimonas prasina]GLR14700.1 hypothetical protein GCM10007907_34900 [Chitinimonas prasina]